MNVELEVGNLNETVTVSGASPIVDVVSNRATVVVDRDIMDAIPTATRSLQARANLIPGTMVCRPPAISGTTPTACASPIRRDRTARSATRVWSNPLTIQTSR